MTRTGLQTLGSFPSADVNTAPKQNKLMYPIRAARTFSTRFEA